MGLKPGPRGAAYQRLLRARQKRNPKHAEVQAVLDLWRLGTEDDTEWQDQARTSARATRKDCGK